MAVIAVVPVPIAINTTTKEPAGGVNELEVTEVDPKPAVVNPGVLASSVKDTSTPYYHDSVTVPCRVQIAPAPLVPSDCTARFTMMPEVVAVEKVALDTGVAVAIHQHHSFQA